MTYGSTAGRYRSRIDSPHVVSQRQRSFKEFERLSADTCTKRLLGTHMLRYEVNGSHHPLCTTVRPVCGLIAAKGARTNRIFIEESKEWIRFLYVHFIVHYMSVVGTLDL